MFTLENISSKLLLTGLLIGSTSLSAATYTVQPGDTVGKIVKSLGFKSTAEAGITSVPSGDFSILRVGDKIEYNLKYPKNVDGALIYPRENGKYQNYNLNTQDIKEFTYGRAPTANEIAAWDLDVMPDGTGLPEGEGNVDEGEELYDKHCVMCHGEFGTGGKGYPPLSGGHGTLANQLLKEGDEPPFRTIGSYWPYASTLWWYIQSAMPFPAPKSLTNDEVYAITAYLLNVNEITFSDGEDIEVLNRGNFSKVDMPNKDGFFPDVNVEAKQAKKNMKDFLGNPEKYGSGIRCMTDCDNAKGLQLVTIKYELSDFDPPMATARDLPKKEEGAAKASKESKIYEESCSACHANKAIGAPVLGDKESWAEVMKKGVDTVYNNALNGVNAMPPKGGNMDLSDDELKAVVDYMISQSK